MICLKPGIAGDLIQATNRVSDEVKSNNLEAKEGIEDGLQCDDLEDDHPGVPHGVAKLSCHFYYFVTPPICHHNIHHNI